MTNSTTEVTPQSRNARFHGITHAARDLGITRGHLYLVLSHQRESKPLVKRWNAWLAANPTYKALQPAAR